MQWFALVLTFFTALAMASDLKYYSGKNLNFKKEPTFYCDFNHCHYFWYHFS